MSASPQNMNMQTTARRKGFKAQFGGICSTCGATIDPDDLIFYPPGSDHVAGIDCCGEKDDLELLPGIPFASTPDEDTTVPPEQVMPRGKTVADLCRSCFQIPSANGACGCF